MTAVLRRCAERGYVTKVSVWHDQGSQWFDVTHTYDGYGNRLTTTDPRSYVAQYSTKTRRTPT
ncbi:MAG: hypothetical protein KIT57_04870 [Blastocatellales bacterium]|nr:hypothetical protein [Blastocatellales bacterium]